MKLHMLAAAVMALAAPSAFAQTVDPNADTLKLVWGGGDPAASEYSSVYVPHIIDVLNQNRLAGYTWAGKSDGTLQNAAEVTDHPTNLAFGQWDLLNDLKGKPIPTEAGKTYDFTVINQDIGPECLYMITKQDGYNTWGDVLGNAWDMTIATGPDDSGSAGTLKLLTGIYPDLKDAKVVDAGGTDDIIKAVEAGGDVTHGFFVIRPDPNSEVFQEIDKAGLHLIPIVDIDLEKNYKFEKLKVANGGFLSSAKYLTTACTSVALITGDPAKVDPTDTRTVRRVTETIARISAVPASTLKPDLATWRDMWDSMTEATAADVQTMVTASKQALDDAIKKAAPKN